METHACPQTTSLGSCTSTQVKGQAAVTVGACNSCSKEVHWDDLVCHGTVGLTDFLVLMTLMVMGHTTRLSVTRPAAAAGSIATEAVYTCRSFLGLDFIFEAWVCRLTVAHIG